MENSNQIPSGDAMNNAIQDEKLNDKKPVGYGSSIQTGGTGNHTRPIDHSKENQTKVDESNNQSAEDAESDDV